MTKSKAIRLGVNIDHIATLREVRQSPYPSVLEAALICKKARVDQITIHLREDRRHIQDRDVRDLIRQKALPVNLELALRDEMVAIVKRERPSAVTLVPERRAEMTTESGLDLRLLFKKSKLWNSLFILSKIEKNAFIDADRKQIEMAFDLGFEGVEFHTGPFAHAFLKNGKFLKREQKELFDAAAYAKRHGLIVKAGHGLTVQNLKHLVDMPGLAEVNIGHAIVARSVFVGLQKAIQEIQCELF